jgi:hypothetical protein
LRPAENPEVAYLPIVSPSPYGLRHSPPLATPLHSRRGAFVLAIRQKASYSSCYHLLANPFDLLLEALRLVAQIFLELPERAGLPASVCVPTAPEPGLRVDVKLFLRVRRRAEWAIQTRLGSLIIRSRTGLSAENQKRIPRVSPPFAQSRTRRANASSLVIRSSPVFFS